MIKSFYLLILLISVSCFRSSPKYCDLSKRLVNKYSKELSKKNIFLMGYGGSFMNNIKGINLSYVSYDKIDIERGRELFIDIHEEYVSRINLDNEIRPYLNQYPFTFENLDIMLRFENEKGLLMGDNFIAFIYYNPKKKSIVYEGFDEEKNELYRVYSEPYEEALRIVNQDKICLK